LLALRAQLDEMQEWDDPCNRSLKRLKQVLTAHGLKMPQLAIPLRVLVCGRTQTPSVDAVLALFDRKILDERLRAGGN
jgi:glutamyl-tRNA synthetase